LPLLDISILFKKQTQQTRVISGQGHSIVLATVSRYLSYPGSEQFTERDRVSRAGIMVDMTMLWYQSENRRNK
jgi:hypothetical protein